MSESPLHHRQLLAVPGFLVHPSEFGGCEGSEADDYVKRTLPMDGRRVPLCVEKADPRRTAEIPQPNARDPREAKSSQRHAPRICAGGFRRERGPVERESLGRLIERRRQAFAAAFLGKRHLTIRGRNNRISRRRRGALNCAIEVMSRAEAEGASLLCFLEAGRRSAGSTKRRRRGDRHNLQRSRQTAQAPIHEADRSAASRRPLSFPAQGAERDDGIWAAGLRLCNILCNPDEATSTAAPLIFRLEANYAGSQQSHVIVTEIEMFTVLHVSDVHFGGPDPTGDQRRITDALVAAVRSDGVKPDLCIFSGDLSFSGTPQQLAEGEGWLRKLISDEWNTKLVVIPGNHDVDRKTALPNTFRKTASAQVLYDEWRTDISGKPPHLKSFFEWHAAAKAGLSLIGNWESPFGFCESFENDGLKVHVLGLNSALFCCDNDDKGNLILDTKTVNEFLSNVNCNTELVIAITHHPLDHLVSWNRERIEILFSQERGIHLHLHGHLHEQLGSSRSSALGQSLTTLEAGAAYQGCKFPQFFAIYTLDILNAEIATRAYTYSDNAGEWVEDKLRSRQILGKLPRGYRNKLSTISDRSPSLSPTDENSIAHIFNNTRKVKYSTRASVDNTQNHNGKENNELTFTKIETDRKLIELEARRFREAASIIQRDFHPYLEKIPIIAENAYAVKSRIKKLDRIRQKFESRVKREPSYCMSQMADICGFRIVTLYQKPIPEIVANLLNLAIDSKSNTASPFVENCTVEMDINTSRPENDPLSIIKPIKSVVAASGLAVQVNPISRETGYSSVHVILSVKVPRDGDHELNEMRVEIQIRSALEDVWGQIDHLLRYGSQRGSAVGVSTQTDGAITWTNHLNIFKGMIDVLVQYVDVIKRHSEEEPLSSPSDVADARTIARPQTQLEKLIAMNLPGEMMARLKEAYHLWKEADLTFERGGDPGLLRRAADEFLEIREEFFGEPKQDAPTAEAFASLVESEAAYLLTYTGDEGDLLKAETLYERILSRSTDNATAHFRLGNVLRRKRQYDSSLTHLRRALAIIDSDLDSSINKSHWVYDDARLGIALTDWRIFWDETRTQAERDGALKESIMFARSVLDKPGENTQRTRIRAINDYLYYIWDTKTNTKIECDIELTDRSVLDLVDELVSSVIADTGFEYNHADTALRFLKDEKERETRVALIVMQRIDGIIRTKKPLLALPKFGSINWVIAISKYLDGDEGDALAYAHAVLSKYGLDASNMNRN